MRRFDDLCPAVTVFWFFLTFGILMFTKNPVILAIGLLSGAGYFAFRGESPGFHRFTLAFILLMTLLDPFFGKSGSTVLLFVNKKPVTLEALIFGFMSGAAVAAALYWFRIFTHVMTCDKVLYMIGGAFPKGALVISMAVRFFPLYKDQHEKIKNAQKSLGLYGDGGVISKIKAEALVFSGLVTWALENGVTTAASMDARGYGIGRRTSFYPFKMTKRDTGVFAFSALSGVPAAIITLTHGMEPEFFPVFKLPPFDAMSAAACLLYAALCFMPLITDLREDEKWISSQSKI